MTTRRRGFTLIEIVVSLVLLGIIGGSMIRLMSVQAKFAETEMSRRNARTVSRNSMNIMLTDIRMVQDAGGMLAGNRDSITLRVPVAMGLVCASGAGGATIAILPTDSAMFAMATYNGWAARDTTSGLYTYMVTNTPVPMASLDTSATAVCADSVSGPGILPLTYGTSRTRMVHLLDGIVGALPGSPAFLYQKITYRFAASTTYPAGLGLYRSISGGATDEIVAPFDTSAKFKFYVQNADTSQAAFPTNPNTVRGVQLILAGRGARIPQGVTVAKGASMTTGIFFKNRRDP